MAAEVSPDGGEAQGAVTDGTTEVGADPRTGLCAGAGVGSGSGAGAGAGAGAGPADEAGAGSASRPEPAAGVGSVGADGWDGLVLDEDFIRSAETAEPSARARMLAARWRQQAPDPQPWRSDEPPAGWFFSKARRRRWRRR